ncbi:glycine receptor subunit alphaZ1-like isoform X1 [Acropora palmata]|uniref:glycine receptor subunit alphaZ1-like isoform X1 n=2 Tax=Acropora palmata TaxID=6131 RepID=UPI003DA19C31
MKEVYTPSRLNQSSIKTRPQGGKIAVLHSTAKKTNENWAFNATRMKLLDLYIWLLLAVLLTFYKADADTLAEFFKQYDKALPPGFEKGDRVVIKCTLYVESFGNIEEANMEYKVYGYFRQYWNDPRLAGRFNRTLTLHGGDIDKLWTPDPFCYNARESNMMMPNEETHTFAHIQPNGNLELSKGVTLLASCVMNLQEFPLDTQTCFLRFGSYGHSVEEIVYEWFPGQTEVLVGNSEMAQFEYKGSNLSSKFELFSEEKFSILTATFYFHRRIGYFLIQVYFPNIFVVVLSWIVFWMEKDDIGNRMALGITTILTIMFLLGSLNGNLPKVSYPKALDWYLLVSFSFVFFSLIECLIVFLFARSAADTQEDKAVVKKRRAPLATRICLALKNCFFGSRTHRRPSETGTPNDESTRYQDDVEMAYGATKTNSVLVDDGHFDETTLRRNRMMKRAEVIDSASRILFPLAFVVYNVYYWSYY